ncbi:MAG: hypothetical protein Q8P84_08165 [Deltaproteobacteria bacterium]|nr:hypothetical protein [Deltaproteobacteria bacterium]
MPHTITHFDITEHHIHVELFVTDSRGGRHSFDGVLDTGAPRTEVSDKFLALAGLIKEPAKRILIKPGLQTQKYGKLVMRKIEICGHTIENFEVLASRFDGAWGIDALVGLDFFRLFRVTVDYGKAEIVTTPLAVI